ncbi:MAG: UDP-3-O-acylglucosamine N-acyltransferase, partial [Pseudomonadota bacterium]
MARALDRDVSLGELVARFGGSVSPGAEVLPVRRLASLAVAGPGDLTFLTAARHRAAAASTRATAAIVSAQLADALPAQTAPLIVADPYAHFAAIARWFAGQLEPVPARGRHPSASVDPAAWIGDDVSIGPGTVIEADARVGAGTTIGPHCHVGRGSEIGEHSRLHAGVVVYHDCRIGARCIVHAGTVIGSDGFGFANEGGRWAKIPQLGGVRIGDDVEIGSNCSIDRGALEDTLIGDGCKLDNLIQIGHNVVIGEHSALAGCV